MIEATDQNQTSRYSRLVRDMILRRGVIGTSIIHSGFAVAVSLALTSIILSYIGSGPLPGLFIAGIASILVATPMVYFSVRMTKRLMDTEQGLSDQLERRHRAEDALQESEERFRRAFEDASIGMLIVDLDGSIRLTNDAFCKMIGYSARELSQKTTMEISHPDDVASSEQARERLLAGHEEANYEEKRLIRNDGSPVWVALTRSLVRDEDGQPIYTIGQMQDVTERRAANEELRRREEQYRELVETTHVIPWELDLDTWNFTYVGPQASSVLGYPVEDWLKDKFWLEHIFPPDREYAMSYCQEATARGEDHSFEYRMVAQDGRIVWLRDLVTVVGDPSNPSMLRGFMIDITEHKQTEEALRQAQKMEVVGQLTGGIAHDFNNLLMGVMGNLEILGMNLKEPELLERIQRSITAVERGGALTSKLLAFSRTQTLRPVLTNVPEVISDMIALLDRSIGGDIEIKTEFEDNLQRTIIDRNQLETALLNLVLNARDAIQNAGTITITCKTATLAAAAFGEEVDLPPGDYLVISVHDDGSGMPPNVTERVFEPFFTTKDIGKGSGLGLSMVFGFVRQSGGHIEIDSREGNGTTVVLYFAVAPETMDGADFQGSEQEDVPRGNGERIYLVEDDVDIRETTAELLSGLGYQVIDGEDGREVEKGGNQFSSIDLLLSDVVLPHQRDGYSIADIARASNPAIKVLLMSGHAEKAGISADHVRLSKPFRMEELAQTISRVLAGAA